MVRFGVRGNGRGGLPLGCVRRFWLCSALKRVAKHLLGTTVDNRHENAPAILAAANQGQIGGTALVRLLSDGAGDLDPRAAAGNALGQRLAFELHNGMGLLDVHPVVIVKAQLASNATHATGGFGQVELRDPSSHRLVDRTGDAIPRLIVDGGTRPA